MQSFPSGISFKYPWRTYQKRVLGEMDDHLDDSHLHLIAPPGSGKTVLGLEVALRLNEPTLILAPTLTIRNQWIQRFYELFLQTNKKVEWISRDIKEPKFLTVDTYQALHAVCTANDRKPENNVHGNTNRDATGNLPRVLELLKAQNIGTVVVDEAHHLKNAWWESLTLIKNTLNPTIVGLTATPPYDVSYTEWQRYIELNGPVDAEISVPELVVEGNLCPHQDYVFFSRPTVDEFQKIEMHRRRIEDLFQEIKADATLAAALEQHPIYQSPGDHLDWIYSNLEYYSATLIFLNAIGKPVTAKQLEIVGDKKFKIPNLNYEWIEILLRFYLYEEKKYFKAYQDHQEALIDKLKRNGALSRRSINFGHHRSINRSLAFSISKLNSIEQIVEFEHDQLKQDLRQVILTDYIQKDFLLEEPENNLVLNKIGVIPIFEKLRRTNDCDIKLGVLTGSLIIIPASTLEVFKEIAAEYNITDISATPLPYDCQYIKVDLTGHLRSRSVSIITQIFRTGAIEVLTGTKSLLGEGWDAPFLNSLILASFVGSYVLTNQMRGRVIRTDPQNPDKTSNIWHLVCIDPTAQDGGEDILLLNRRLKTFVGVSFDEQSHIENGTNRLNLPDELNTLRKIEEANADMLERAGQRDQLKKEWYEALENGTTLIEEIKVPFPTEQDYTKTKSLYYNRTIAYLFGLLGSGFLIFVEWVFRGVIYSMQYVENTDDFFRWLIVISTISLVAFGIQLFRTFRIYIKYRDISKDIHQIGEALLKSLIKVGVIKTDYSELQIVSDIDDSGAIYCRLAGGTTYEKSTFIKSLEEIVSIVESPRYILIRKSFFLKLIAQKDYHTVPEILGRNKKTAKYFQQQWEKFVGSCGLVYTRTIKGRKLLLKSRIQSLVSEFEDKTERINKWK